MMRSWLSILRRLGSGSWRLMALVLVLLSTMGRVEGQVADSTATEEVIYFDEGALDDYRSDGDYQYDRNLAKIDNPNWFQRFFRWLIEQIDSLYSGNDWRSILFFVLIVVGLVVALVLVMTRRKSGALMFGKSDKIAGDITEEDIQGINFDEEIAKAKAKGEYRVAVRLMYLKGLRVLTDREAIVWEEGKTNYEYVRDLGGTPYQQAFSRLVRVFDYAWYGDFPVTEAGLAEAEENLQSLTQSAK